jgi:general secretion pathway protein F/type IV pilus assembly protein PilC
MTLYTYRALTRQGQKSEGSIEAESLAAAKEKVRSMQLMLTSIEVQKRALKKQQLSKENLMIFTSQLSQLLASKIPIYESLLALEEQARNEPFHPVLLGLTERIKRGTSLSQSMNDFPDSFSPLYRALISAGEAVGNMELALNRLNSFLTHQGKIQKQLISALIYPALLMLLLIGASAVLVGFVIPALESLFEDRPIPAFTQIVLSTSHFLQSWGLLLLGTLASAIAFIVIRLRNPEAKASLQRNLLKVPLISRYVILSCLGRFARTLSTLLDGGLPLTNSLAFATESLNNARLEEVMKRVEGKIIEGIPLSHELSRYKEIPPLFARMTSIGEESGKLAGMLSQLATLYEEETERTLTRLVQLAQPVLLLIMGGLVGGVLLSILLPLSSFGSSIQL